MCIKKTPQLVEPNDLFWTVARHQRTNYIRWSALHSKGSHIIWSTKTNWSQSLLKEQSWLSQQWHSRSCRLRKAAIHSSKLRSVNHYQWEFQHPATEPSVKKHCTCCRNHQIHGQKKILPIQIQKAFRRTIRNLEPLLKGCLAAAKKSALYVSKEVKENGQSHQRSNPAGQEQKPQKINKNVCVKQQLHGFKLYKDKWQKSKSVKIVNLNSRSYSTRQRKWLEQAKQHFSMR